MSIERELLQTALGILEDYEWGYGGDHHKSPEASILNDIRKLLAQPEQEPVAWGVYDPDSDMLISIYGYKERPDKLLKERFEWVKLYLAPPKREPLSKEQYMKCFTDTYENLNPITDFVRAIEKAHGIGVDDE